MRTITRRGFTLIELVMVFVLIGIMGALAIPRLNTYKFKADAAMHTVQSAMQQAQRSAVQRQTNVVVSFDTAHARIQVLYDANNNGAVDPGEDVRWRSLEDGNRFAAPPVGLTTVNPGAPLVGNNLRVNAAGLPTVTYRRDGASSSSVEIYLRSAGSDVNDFRAIAVTQATGRVDLFRYGNGQWRKAR